MYGFAFTIKPIFHEFSARVHAHSRNLRDFNFMTFTLERFTIFVYAICKIGKSFYLFDNSKKRFSDISVLHDFLYDDADKPDDLLIFLIAANNVR